MILSVDISKERREAILYRYPGIEIKYFVEKIISDTADKIIIERDFFNVEKELAEYRDRRVLNGYDFKRRKMTQETKDKISKAIKAKGYKGIPLLEETRQKMMGRIVSKETRDKISKANRGKKRSEEQRKNLSQGHKGLKYKRKVKIK